MAEVKVWYDSFNAIHPVVLWHINIGMYYRQATNFLIISLVNSTCFGF